MDREGGVEGDYRGGHLYFGGIVDDIGYRESNQKRKGRGRMLVGKAASTINKTMQADADLTHGRWGR